MAQLLGEVGAKEIGRAAHASTDSKGNTVAPKIDQPTQLALHGALGCALSAGAGGGCASGAVAGITSEYIADRAYSNGVSGKNSILIGQATGAGAALLISAAQGRDDEQTAKDTQLGSFVGVNAVTNNLMLTPDIGTPQPGIDDESLAEVEEARNHNSPMEVNRDIELARGGVPQTIYQGGSSVYKSGAEQYGILDPSTNNIGIGNRTNADHAVGSQVQFTDLLQKGFMPTLANEGGAISLGCNYLVPGCNDMSITHDNWAQNSWFIKENSWANQASIPAAYIYNTYGLIGKPLNMVVDQLKAIGNDRSQNSKLK